MRPPARTHYAPLSPLNRLRARPRALTSSDHRVPSTATTFRGRPAARPTRDRARSGVRAREEARPRRAQARDAPREDPLSLPAPRPRSLDALHLPVDLAEDPGRLRALMEPRPRMGLPPTEFRSPGEGVAWLGGLVLALSSFMSSYTFDADVGFTVSITGWHTGALGKLVFFVGLAVLAFLALRASGVELPPSVA